MRKLYFHIKKLFSVKLWAGAFCAYLLNKRVDMGAEMGTVDCLLAAGVLCFMGINVLQDFIFIATKDKGRQ